jgi:hypothetical protein
MPRLADVFGMSDRVWRRHANPWSVWTRFVVLPLMALAIWSRVWIGPWAWAPVVALLVWLWVNPRVFAEPRSTQSWASRAVLGERIWLNRKREAIPAGHCRAAARLSLLSGAGLAPLVWGLWKLEIWPTVLGAVCVYIGKMWFLDRMVWLHQDMADKSRPSPCRLGQRD